MFVPRSLGGRELPQPEYLPVVEALGYADASTGWCVNQGAVFMTTSAFIDRGAAERIWDSPRTVIANGPSPTALARRVPNGYRVTGRWSVLERVPPRDVARRALGARRRAGGSGCAAPRGRWSCAT